MRKVNAKLVEGQVVSLHDILEIVKQARKRRGLSPEDVARDLGVPARMVEQAENQPLRGRFRLRRRMLEQLTGYTLKGPYYRLARKQVDV